MQVSPLGSLRNLFLNLTCVTNLLSHFRIKQLKACIYLYLSDAMLAPPDLHIDPAQ